MDEINLNYAATSNKKPQKAIDSMCNYLAANNFKSTGRGGDADFIEFEARTALGKLFNVKKTENIIFTQNATFALNMIISGALKPGDHVLSTSLEHNAVSRPLELLSQKQGVTVTYLPCENGEGFEPSVIKNHIKPNTKLMVMTHASNVSGAILDYAACAKIAKEYGLLFVLDGAQTAGIIDIDFERSDMDAFVFTGHKTLMGPTGTGGIILKSEAAQALEPIISGGTGSNSHSLLQPDFMPDKFSAGTPNTLGILGLGASVSYIMEAGINNIWNHEVKLTNMFIEGIKQDGVYIYGPKVRVPIVCFNIEGVDNGILEGVLQNKFGIGTRSGLHCSPLAHKSIGTYPTGALRASFGYFNTENEIKYAIDAVNKIVKNREEIEKWI
ncbi:MAG: aminotransferase class V-fold PLP-dependent enzyme [Defluviitaleaceae bacterium]|nr:aminotransferase class V-fold PLP-dependent enzyme [Defluviitaleaceae bacterium]